MIYDNFCYDYCTGMYVCTYKNVFSTLPKKLSMHTASCFEIFLSSKGTRTEITCRYSNTYQCKTESNVQNYCFVSSIIKKNFPKDFFPIVFPSPDSLTHTRAILFPFSYFASRKHNCPSRSFSSPSSSSNKREKAAFSYSSSSSTLCVVWRQSLLIPSGRRRKLEVAESSSSSTVEQETVCN